MSSYLGKNLHVSIFGQSHASAIGVAVDGLPAGEPINLDALEAFLQDVSPTTPETLSGEDDDDGDDAAPTGSAP